MAMQYTGIPIYIEKYRVKVQGQSTGSKKEGKVSNILIYIERVKYIYIKNSILNFKSEKNITNSESKGKSKMFSPLCLKYVSICFFFYTKFNCFFLFTYWYFITHSSSSGPRNNIPIISGWQHQFGTCPKIFTQSIKLMFTCNLLTWVNKY